MGIESLCKTKRAGIFSISEGLAEFYLRRYGAEPKTVEELTETGVDLLEKGRVNSDQATLKEAVSIFQAAIKLEPDNAGLHNFLAVAFWESGQLDKANASLDDAIRLAPQFAPALCNKGELLYDQGDWRGAEPFIDRAIDADHHLAEALGCKGMILERAGDSDGAAKAHSKAIKLNPENPVHYLNRALSYSRAQDYKKCLTDLRAAQRLEPHYADICVDIGDVLKLLEFGKQAAQSYGKALKLFEQKAQDKRTADDWRAAIRASQRLAAMGTDVEPDYASLAVKQGIFSRPMIKKFEKTIY